MSMEKDYILHELHTKPVSVTALSAYVPRREIFLGFEDGIIISIEADTGKPVQNYKEHKGYVTSFLYWPANKILFSSSNDSVLVAFAPGGNVADKIFIGTPIYAMSIINRRKEIVFGVAEGLQFHKLYENKDFNHFVDPKPCFTIYEHANIVRCVVTSDSRIYSGGYDGAFVIYDCHYTGRESAIKVFKNKRAHDAGITSMLVEKDNIENNTWVVTGSFDKTLKIWTSDGKIIQKLDGFISSISSICYLPKNKTIWCVAGTSSAYIFDPKSGENVTNYIETFNNELNQTYYLQLIKYLNEYNIMVTTTSRKQLICYKYNPTGCLTSLKYKKSLDSICFTSKAPILIFTGDSEGSVVKWEQTQTNQLVYSFEKLMKNDQVARESSRIQGQAVNAREQIPEKKDTSSTNDPDLDAKYGMAATSNVSILKLIFVEKLDLVIGACEDGNIYVWGFDQESVKILKNMRPLMTVDKESESLTENEFDNSKEFIEKMIQNKEKNKDEENANENEINEAIGEILGEDYRKISNVKNGQSDAKSKSQDSKSESDSVTNRVAGFTLKKILSEHTSSVTSLVAIDRPDLYTSTYLLSAGWDRRICIWDLEKLRLFDLFRNKHTSVLDHVELASDGNILDMCYCDKNDYFAYASTDTMCYIRKFSQFGSEMVLVNTLQGHQSDVNCIEWNTMNDTWITGGEDNTLRIWNESGDCIHLINCGGAVNSFCIDLSQSALIVAAHDTIKVFELDDYKLVQTNLGHLDSIRDIILIAERNYFVSVSWDRTMKIWRTWRKPTLVRQEVETNKEIKFETWVWEQIKMSVKNDSTLSNGSVNSEIMAPLTKSKSDIDRYSALLNEEIQI